MKIDDMIETIQESRQQLMHYEACIEMEGEDLEKRKEEESDPHQLDVIYKDMQKSKAEAVEVRKRIDELEKAADALTQVRKALD